MKVATITIDHTKVAGDLTDFVVAVIPNSDAGWDELYAVATESGGDIRTFKAGGAVELPRENVSFSVVGKTGEIHIKYTGTLSSSVDTDIEIHADGSSSDYAVGSTYGRNAVWSDYEFVLHLGEAVNNSSGGYVDSTGNGFDGTGSSMSITAPTGQMGNAQEFDGSADKITFNPAGLSFTSLTFQTWFNSQTLSRPDANVAIVEMEGGAYRPLLGFRTGNDRGINAFIRSNTTGNAVVSPDGQYTANTWNKVTLLSSSGSQDLILNGSSIQTDNEATGTFSGFDNAQIGSNTPPDNLYYNGEVDEVRLRTDKISSQWETTEYNNQFVPSSFYAVAAEAGAPAASQNSNFLMFM